MSAAENAWPAVIARHPGLSESLARGRAEGWPLYPQSALCGFLTRLEQRYPGMQVSVLRPVQDRAPGATYDACRGWSAMGEWSSVVFRWSAGAILAAGLLKSDQVPQGRKRVCYGDALGATKVRRCAGGLLEVVLFMPPDMAADHPLAFFTSASLRESARPAPVLRLAAVNGERCPEASPIAASPATARNASTAKRIEAGTPVEIAADVPVMDFVRGLTAAGLVFEHDTEHGRVVIVKKPAGGAS